MGERARLSARPEETPRGNGQQHRSHGLPSRRDVLLSAARHLTAIGAVAQGLIGFPALAVRAQRQPVAVGLPTDIEPLVRLIEDTPRDRLLEDMGKKVRRGLAYRDLLTALQLAGARHIEPRPVGFKFHAVLVVHSAHLASVSSPAADRWLPLFWALDDFKHAQYWDARSGDWTLGSVSSSYVPPSHSAPRAFEQAMEAWDEAAADAAAAGLARGVAPRDVFDLLCRFGARDFRDIGHKAIYVANAWRALQLMGWQYAEPMLRSVAYALLSYDGSNPAQSDDPADRSFRQNVSRLSGIRADWQVGKLNSAATRELLATLRQASAEAVAEAVVGLLNRGVAPQSIWDAILASAADLMLREPGIMALHAVTTTNAIHYAFQTTENDTTRRLLLLQNAAFITLFRTQPESQPHVAVETLRPAALKQTGPAALESIFADIDTEPRRAARKTLAYLDGQQSLSAFMAMARRLLLRKANNAHDYKFTSAVLENYPHLSPEWRNRFLAANVLNLDGSGAADNPIVKRIRAALAG